MEGEILEEIQDLTMQYLNVNDLDEYHRNLEPDGNSSRLRLSLALIVLLLLLLLIGLPTFVVDYLAGIF